MIFHGDCLDVLKTLPDNSIDSVVTDPPYGLSFMGKKWDYDVPSVEIWAECLRVLKPGGYLLAFAGTRTQHRMAVRIEDAGFEIRDMIAWVYGSGFPKSHDVSKAIDKAAGAEREVIGENPNHRPVSGVSYDGVYQGANTGSPTITAPATEAARQWAGWGTALKPALEPITVARKPLIGTVAENVLAHGTGALNVDGCRVAHGDDVDLSAVQRTSQNGRPEAWRMNKAQNGREIQTYKTAGRWPANLIHDGSEDVLALFPQSSGGAFPKKSNIPTGKHYEGGWGVVDNGVRTEMGSGSAARFFYCAKTSKKDRDEGLDGFDVKQSIGGGGTNDPNGDDVCGKYGSVKSEARNYHPTVKPTDLMRYLCRLVTPPNGTVLDPFTGSGSTGKAAILEGFNFIGIEREAEYVDIATARINAALESIKNKHKPGDTYDLF
jgi:site-specific DNA-methyltransferase (adenine-specific)